jgi:hypothetical protein
MGMGGLTLDEQQLISVWGENHQKTIDTNHLTCSSLAGKERFLSQNFPNSEIIIPMFSPICMTCVF